jgi:hypothetical protein
MRKLRLQSWQCHWRHCLSCQADFGVASWSGCGLVALEDRHCHQLGIGQVVVLAEDAMPVEAADTLRD